MFSTKRDDGLTADPIGAIARQAADKSGRNGKQRPASREEDTLMAQNSEPTLLDSAKSAVKSGLKKVMLVPDADELRNEQNSDAAGLRENLRQADEVHNLNRPASMPVVAPVDAAPSATDLINPKGAPYGSRKGEARLDSEGNIIPSAASQVVSKEVLQRIPNTPEWRAAKAVATAMPKVSLPSYDEGGDVPEDQVALVHKDEKVLPPDEAAAYRAEHSEGAPADFAGRVIPNPNGIKPVLDTEIQTPSDTDRLPKGVKADINNAPLTNPKGDTSNPPTAQAIKPISTSYEEKPTQGSVLGAEWLKRMGVQPAETTTEDVSGTIPARPSTGMPKVAMPQDMHQETAGGPLISDTNTETPSERRDFAGMERKAQLADYDKRIQTALNLGTPEGQEQADRLKLAKDNYVQNTPWGSESNHPGFLGKVAHVGEEIASRTPFGISAIASTIPGSEGNRGIQKRDTQADLAKSTELATQRAAEEDKETPKPKLLSGEENVRTAADGSRERAWQMPSGAVQWVPEGQTPTAAAPAAQATIGTQPSLVTAATNASKYTYGKPVPPKEGEQPATSAQLADVTSRLTNNPYVPKAAVADLQFPEGYTPTANDVKERLSNIKEIEDASRAGKQDEFNNGLRKLQEENANLMAKAHLQDLEDKHKAADGKAALAADVATVGLYAQENYKNAMDAWYKSGHFAKDSGLVTQIVDKEHSEKGAFSGVMGDALVGSLLGPEGAALGAGVGAVSGLIAGPANGYLDTLYKQGISKEGYDAMQAYFNALPARMSYEIGVQGVSASALRSTQLIQKVLNTIPAPNTPQKAFDSAYRQYYKPMETLTKGKIKLTAPKGYEPPSMESIYPTKSEKSEVIPTAENNKYHMQNAKGEIVSNDGTTWYDLKGKKVGK